MGISEQSTLLCEQKLLTSRQIFQYAVPARTVTKKHWSYDTKCVRSCRRRSGNGGVAFRAHAKASRLCFTVVESFFSVCLSIHLLCQSARFFPHHINSRRPLTYTTAPCSHPNTHTKKATTVNQLDQLSLSSFRGR